MLLSFLKGNHEYYTGDIDGWLKELEYLGVTPLHNSHVLLTYPNKPQAKLCLAGVDDVEGRFLRLAIYCKHFSRKHCHIQMTVVAV